VCGDNVELRRQLEELLAYENGDEGPQETVITPAISPVSHEHQAEELAPVAAPDRCIGPYRLLELIGEGGMGYVLRPSKAILFRDMSPSNSSNLAVTPTR